MSKPLLILSLTLMLGACVQAPQLRYDQEVKGKGGPVAQTYSEALRMGAPAEPLPVGHSLFHSRWEIGPSQPLMAQGDHLTNYRLFSFQLHQGQKYSVHVGALCDCFGLNKYIIKPYAVVIGSNGQALTPPFMSEWETEAGVTWAGVAGIDGTAYLLVAADNHLLSQPINNFGYTAQSAPFGKVVAWVEYN